VVGFSGIVCVASFHLGGIRGKKITPSVGWEVLLRSHRSASGSWTKRARENEFRAFAFGYGTVVYICIEW
jgi:hypothetical protein